MLFRNPMATMPEEIQEALKILEGKKLNSFGCKTCCNAPHLALTLSGSQWTRENFMKPLY